MMTKMLDWKHRNSGSEKFARSFKWLVYTMAFLVVALTVSPAYSAERGDSDSLVSNVRFRVSGLNIVIHYDLNGDPGAKYNVALVLRNRIDPSFSYTPKALSGDVGTGMYAGGDREIIWDIRKEFPQGLQGNGYYFVVDARKVSSGNSLGLLAWVGAGAVAVAAVVTYLIVMRNGGPTSPASYPAPPGRP